MEGIEEIYYGVKALLGEQADVLVVKRNEMHTFEVIPKWWVVA